MISELALTTTVLDDNMWILDTGATMHVTRNPKLLHQMRYGTDTISVRTASGHSYPVQGRECLNMEMDDGWNKTIKNILCVSSMTCNLLSVNELADNGLLACFDDKRCLIDTKDPEPITIANGVRDNNSRLHFLYLTGRIKKVCYFVTLTDDF